MITDRTGAPTTVARREEEFTIAVNGQTVGTAAFTDHGNQRTFTHTEVDIAFQGRGLATILIGEAMKSTKAEGLRIVAICAMVASFLEKHKEFGDVVDPVIGDTEIVS
jgi:predicted GNAT family acetyltransferase